MQPDVGSLLAKIHRANATILEIGANDGADTEKFLVAKPFAHIFCFEPDPRALQKHRNRINDQRVTLFDMAIGRQSGKRTFFQSGGTPPHGQAQEWEQGWDLSGSIKRPANHKKVHPWVAFENTLEVSIMSLDDWASRFKIDVIDFIWVDVQGAENEVIEGGLKTLARSRFFFAEYSNEGLYEGESNLDELRNMLPMFEVVEVFESDVLFENKSFANNTWNSLVIA